MPIRIFNFFLVLCVVGGFFVLPKITRAATADHLVISQVQITGGTGQTNNDFLEIYNSSSVSVNISDWQLKKRIKSGTESSIKVFSKDKIIPAHGYFLWANTANNYNQTIGADESSSVSLTDDNSVALFNNSGVLIDAFAWGSSHTNPFIEGSASSQNPGANQSTERKPGGDQGNGEDSDNNSQDFLSPAASHPRNSQSPIAPPIENPPPPPPPTAPNVGDILINEFLPSPAAGQLEWIEFYNKTANNFDLTGWKIYDGTGSAIATLGQSISANGFLAVDLVGSKLNNSGDIIILKDSLNTIFDQTTYGDWDDGNLDDNAPSAISPNTVARKIDGQDSNVDANDFSETITPTKGSANIITGAPPTAPPAPSDTFSAGDIVINEFVPNPSEGKEWVEFYLNKNSDINLENWKVYDSTTDVILTLTGNLATVSRFAVFEISSSRLNNDGDTIILKSPDGTIIDQVIYGKESNNAPVSDKAGQSVARQSNGADTNNDAVDFILSDQPTKGTANIIVQTEIKSGSTTTSSALYTVPKPLVFINEFVSDPTDNEGEWIELYNAGEVSVELAGWTIEEGSKAKTELSGVFIPGQFKIISPIKGSLNNDGDIIFLKDEKENILDTVAYGNWNDGNVSDNAPVAADPASVARLYDGYSTNNLAKDFVVASAPTKGKSNVSVEGLTKQDNQARIILNELVPNPAGDDNQEFIEIKNMETRLVNLDGWFLKDESGKKYTIAKAGLAPGGFYVVKRTQSGLALNNDADSVYLYAPNGDLKDKIDYQNAKSALSWSRFNNLWQWTATPTPNKENILAKTNHLPQIALSVPAEVLISQPIDLDAGDSYDEDDDNLSFTWIIDGENFTGSFLKHTFKILGDHNIKLTVSDGKDSAIKEIKIKAVEKLSQSNFQNLFISEALPNPVGDDSGEWIEIYYNGEAPLDLTGFKLDDEEGGSRPYKISDKKILPGAYLVFERAETKLALNNSGDKVRLFDSQGNLIQETAYGSAPEGLSWSRQLDGRYIWSQPSKSAANNSEAAAASSKGNQGAVLEMSLKEAREADLGEKVRVRGVIAAPPGILGSQIFYLAGSGMQVFMSKKDFPDLKVGDLVEVAGELSEAQGEKRIKVAAKEDIKFIKNGEPVAIHQAPLAEIGEDWEGNLISVTGAVIESRSGKIILEDGGDELAVYVKKTTNIDPKIFVEGAQVKVIGILSQNKTGFQLLPRFKEDVEILQAALPAAAAAEESLSANDKSKTAKDYLAVTAGGLTSVLITLGLRNRLWRLIPFTLLAGFFRGKKKE